MANQTDWKLLDLLNQAVKDDEQELLCILYGVMGARAHGRLKILALAVADCVEKKLLPMAKEDHTVPKN